jgi:ABC-type Na+ transport system ATPase subunit NatA
MSQSGSSATAESAPGESRTLSAATSRTTVLRAVDATFVRDGREYVEPFSIEISSGESATLECRDATSARIAARMAAGIVKTTSGTLLVCEFDPRIQPVQAKRLTGYVPARGELGRPGEPSSRAARDAIDLQAALFEVPSDEAQRRVRENLEALDARSSLGIADAELFAVALALIRPVALLVMERPSEALAERVAAIVPSHTSLLQTRTPVQTPAFATRG